MFEETKLRDRWDTLHTQPRYRPLYPNENVIRWRFRNFPRDDVKQYRFLDLGCGAGRHAIALARDGFDVHATDLSETGINFLQSWASEEGLKVSAKVGVVENIEYPDDYFDGLVCFGVYNYLTLDAAVEAFSELHRVLKPGGKCFVMLRSDDDWRKEKGTEVSPGVFQMDELKETVAEAEDGLGMTLFSEPAVHRCVTEFKNVDIDFCATSLNGGLDVQKDWYVSAEK